MNTAEFIGREDRLVASSRVTVPSAYGDEPVQINYIRGYRTFIRFTRDSTVWPVQHLFRTHIEPDGDIVFISSIGGTGGTVDASYAASKAGLHGLTRSLAREYGNSGLQVNAVAPGPVETDMNDAIVEYLETIEFRGHENVDTHLPQYACPPKEVAHTVAYLLENEYVQGEIVNVNGGMQFR